MGELEPVLPLIQLVANLIGRRCDKFLGARYGLTYSQYQFVLAAVHEKNATLSGLSEHLQCSPGNVTGIADRLERDGWIERQRSLTDRRTILIRPTEKAESIEKIHTDLREELSSLIQNWVADERQAICSMLVRMYKELKE